MINHAEDLSQQLDAIAVGIWPPGRSELLAATQSTVQSLLEAEKNSIDARPTQHNRHEAITDAVLRFRQSRSLNTYRQTKYVCLGASQSFSGWFLLQDYELLTQLLARVRVGFLRERLKLFYCLLYSFWAFPRDEEETCTDARLGWLKLREWLSTQRSFLHRTIEIHSRWFTTLDEHLNLFTDDPCERYAHSLGGGLCTTFDQMALALRIPSRSWLRNEALLAQMRAGAELDDATFHSRVSSLIDLATGMSEATTPRSIRRKCIAILISRYASCTKRPELIPLRDAALALIGAPATDRKTWDIHVTRDDGSPNDAAREMIQSWLKVCLIKDFFGLLSQDGKADCRRLRYWLSFEAMIRETWFALGPDSLNTANPEYCAFRQRARGRTISLTGNTPTSNNAFLMDFGSHFVVEFGITDNACFIFSRDQLPPAISNRLTGNDAGGNVDIAELKACDNRRRLRHNGNWEPRFTAALSPLLGVRLQIPDAKTIYGMNQSKQGGMPAF